MYRDIINSQGHECKNTHLHRIYIYAKNTYGDVLKKKILLKISIFFDFFQHIETFTYRYYTV